MKLKRHTIPSLAATVAATVLLIPAAAGSAAAAGTAPAALYVNNVSGANCSATGPGTQAQPYCTVQQAADVAVAGQTVHITGYYPEAVVLTRSGTAGAPIVFDGGSSNFSSVTAPTVASGPAFALRHVHDVVIRNLDIGGQAPTVVAVDRSKRVTVERNVFGGGATSWQTQPFLHITGKSADVTVDRNQFEQSYGPTIGVDAGGSGVTIARNDISAAENGGIQVAGTPNARIIGNTVVHSCNSAVSVTGLSTGSVVADNILGYVFGSSTYYDCPSAPTLTELSADATAAPALAVDDNIVFPYTASPAYLWGGTAYTTSSDFHTATGQGAHDLTTDPGLCLGCYAPVPQEGSPAIDSADAGILGAFVSDYYTYGPVDDLLVPNTGVGAGTGVGYVDRGAYEFEDGLQVQAEASAPAGPLLNQVTLTADATANPWSDGLTSTFDFGDGSTPVTTTAASVTHTYAAPGTYTVTLTGVATSHAAFQSAVTVTIAPPPAA